MNVGENYRHSGRFTVTGVLLSVILGAVAGWALAWPYAYSILYVPIVGVFTCLIAGGFGLLAGLCAGLALHWRKVRSAPVAGVVGFVTGLAALYAGWAVWLHAVIARVGESVSSFALLLYPPGMWEVMRQINQVGIFTLRGIHPTGIGLWVLWGAEAAIIVGCAAYATHAFIQQDPFCETCEQWAGGKDGVARVRQADPDTFQRIFVTRDFSQLEKLGAAQKPDPHLRLDIHECDKCKAFQTLTVTQFDYKDVKGKKEKEESSKTVVNKLIIASDEAGKIRAIGETLGKSAVQTAGA